MKKSKPNTDVEKPKKIVPWREELESLGIGNLLVMSDDMLDRIGLEFVQRCKEWLASDEGKRYCAERYFVAEKGLRMQSVRRWRERNPLFDQRYRAGMELIGMRIEERMMDRQVDAKSAAFVLHNYLERYEKDNKYHADLKNIKDAVAQLLGMTFEVPDLEDNKK